jgi:hypothetical protein
MKEKHAHDAHDRKPFDPGDYPALRDFFPAYLHQDFVEEYSSAADALRGFLAEASGDEIVQVKEEWNVFRQAFRSLPLQEIQTAVGQLGSAWLPESQAQLEEWDELINHAET